MVVFLDAHRIGGLLNKLQFSERKEEKVKAFKDKNQKANNLNGEQTTTTDEYKAM